MSLGTPRLRYPATILTVAGGWWLVLLVLRREPRGWMRPLSRGDGQDGGWSTGQSSVTGAGGHRRGGARALYACSMCALWSCSLPGLWQSDLLGSSGILPLIAQATSLIVDTYPCCAFDYVIRDVWASEEKDGKKSPFQLATG